MANGLLALDFRPSVSTERICADVIEFHGVLGLASLSLERLSIHMTSHIT